ncbi:AMP-binding enzyme [Musa troglodytarum]|uniref:AMP-binding enzyme n=1 Tax=Musa troglodytarum TaxID=320322 RepID=A0A9E7K8M2_9LILI|nr:AMP-binding enzyme [Musa troglodytarum]
MAYSRSGVDPRSGYCDANSTFYSKRPTIALPADPNLSVTAFLASRRHSGTTALIDAATGHRLSFAALWRSVAAVATALASPPLSVRKPHVVLLLSPNSVHFPVVSLAVMSLGAVLTTTNPLNTPVEIGRQLADSCPVLAFTTRALIPKLASAPDLRIVLLDDSRRPSDDGRIVATVDEMIATEPDPARTAGAVSQDDTATLLLLRHHGHQQGRRRHPPQPHRHGPDRPQPVQAGGRR